jgi:hypothetical protein
MTKHSSVVGGSNAARVMACPPSRLLCAGIPQDEGNEHSRRGTALHTMMEIALSTGDPDFDIGVGAVIEGHMVTSDDCAALRAAHEAYESTGIRAPMLERQVSMPNIKNAYGTIDVLGQCDLGKNWVLDWKFGHGIQVYPDNNKQLMFYAAAAAFGKDTRHMFIPDRDVVLAIVQPNSRGEPVLRTHTVTLDELYDFTVQLSIAVKRGETAPFAVGDHCRFCPAKLICPEIKKVTAHPTPAAPLLSAAELADALDRIAAFEIWATEVRKVAHQQADSGAEIPRYKLVDKRPTRKWADEQKAMKRLSPLGLDVFDTSLRSPAQLDAMIKEAGIPVSDLIVSVSSGTVLVPDSDKREALSIRSSNPLSAVANFRFK